MHEQVRDQVREFGANEVMPHAEHIHRTDATIPEEALASFHELLLPNLEPMPPDQLDNRIGRLCRRSELSPEIAVPGNTARRRSVVVSPFAYHSSGA